jgi:hypothetical protein
MAELSNVERHQQALQIMTTEHFILQGGRGTTISEANGRVSSFLITVSSTLVALAFVGQISRLGSAFYLFGLVLFPSVLFIGICTFERVQQSGNEDVIYVREMSRIRHYYAEIAPEVAGYFLLSTHDDAAGLMADMGAFSSKKWHYFQPYLTTAGMVAVINSVIAGAFAGMAIGALFGPPLAVSAVVGVVAFLVSVFFHQRYQWAQWMALDARLPTLFPSSELPTPGESP